MHLTFSAVVLMVLALTSAGSAPPPEAVKGWPLVGEKIYEAWSLSNENLTAPLSTYQEPIKSA